MSVYRPGTNKSSILNYPTIRPILDLDFANSKTLDPRITFTRSSGGSYVGPDGLIKYAGVNEARFDHDPTTGESLGLLIEEARTNIVTYSEDFSDGSWTKVNAGITTNTSATTAPDGTMTADKLVTAVTTNTEHIVYKSPVVTGTYTLSVFAKQSGYNFLALRIDDSAAGVIRVGIFDLVNGKISNDSGLTSSSITPYPNGWYRCSITTVGQVTNYVIAPMEINGYAGFSGNGSSGVYLWGAQLEQGAFPTSYIPTVASTRTRAAEFAKITGSSFLNIYNQNEGTFKAEGIVNFTLPADTYGAVFGVGARNDAAGIGGVSNFIYINPGNDLGYYVSNLGQSPASQIGSPVLYPNNKKYKSAAAYTTDNFAYSFNGSISTSTFKNALYKSHRYFCIGTSPINDSPIATYGVQTISRLTYYPKKLPNAQLQALTR